MKRSRPRPRSKRREGELEARAQVRRQVLERDRFCKYPRCVRDATEVHELYRGQLRATTYLDPSLCIGLCFHHHRWVTDHPEEAHELGLVKWSWELDQTT